MSVRPPTDSLLALILILSLKQLKGSESDRVFRETTGSTQRHTDQSDYSITDSLTARDLQYDPHYYKKSFFIGVGSMESFYCSKGS